MNDKDVTLPLDTPPDIMARQRAWFAEKTPEERFMLGLQMAEDGRQLAMAGIRMEHPEYSEKEVIEALSRRFYPELFEKKEA